MDKPFVHRHRVRFHECDPQGRVFNSRFLDFVDDAMVEWYRAHGDAYRALSEAGYDYVVAEATTKYLAPARLDQLLEIEVASVALGRTSMSVSFRIEVEDGPVAECQLRYVCLQRRSGEKAAWPRLVVALVPATD